MVEKVLLVVFNFDSVYNSILDSDICELLKIFFLDEFEGCLFIIEGEEKIIDYLVSEFIKVGFKLGNGDSFL